MSQRVKLLEAALLLIAAVRNRLEYYREPVNELAEYLCTAAEIGELDFIKECERLCKKGEPFPKAWEDALRGQPMPLTHADREQLALLGASIGSTDLEGQLTRLKMHSGAIERSLENAREQSEKYGAVCIFGGLSAGIAFGLFIV